MLNTSHLVRIEAIASRYSNASSFDMKAQATNAANNCAAFWHAGTSTGALGFLIERLNETQDVRRALKLMPATVVPVIAMLDKLLPLNDAAARSLADAYHGIGTFRSEAELLRRTDRAEDEAEDALLALKASGGTGLFRLDYARIDAATRALNRQALTAPVSAVRLSEVA